MPREKDIEEGMVPLGTNTGGDTADDIDDVEGGTTQIDDIEDGVTNSELDATSPSFAFDYSQYSNVGDSGPTSTPPFAAAATVVQR